jgi:hypothetical protein
MATANLEKELKDREQRYWRALAERDTAAALELTAFPCLVTGPSGVMQVDREDFTGMMQKASYTIERVELKDVQVHRLTEDVAVVAYKVHEEMIVDGKKVAVDAADSSTWVRQNGRWACAVHTESLVGDPFGRDRKPN